MPIPFFFLQKFTENCFKEFIFPTKAIGFEMVALTPKHRHSHFVAFG